MPRVDTNREIERLYERIDKLQAGLRRVCDHRLEYTGSIGTCVYCGWICNNPLYRENTDES